MTSAAYAMLVDEGKIRWDDPVTNYLPEFQLWDPWVTREITVRDLLTHRADSEGLIFSGLGGTTRWREHAPASLHTSDCLVPIAVAR
jgi:CubicO group peptidase (beta-lactamase class C family)